MPSSSVIAWPSASASSRARASSALASPVLLGLNALSKARELLSMLFVERQAQSARISHAPNRTASGDAVSKPC